MITINKDDEVLQISEKLPVLPLRDVVVFPYMIVPLLVGRYESVNALEEAMIHDKILMVISQRKPETPEPEPKDLYRVGTVVRVLQLLRLPDGTMRVLVEGLLRARVHRYLKNEDFMLVKIEPMMDETDDSVKTKALVRSVTSLFEEYVQLNRRIPEEVLASVSNIEDPDRFVDTVAAHLLTKVSVKQSILEAANLEQRLKFIRETISSELEILRLEKKIEGQVKDQLQKSQKEFYLHQQMKAIQQELGQEAENGPEIAELKEAIADAKMSKEAEEKAMKELDRLAKMSPMSPEATVVRTYIDWLVALPWQIRTTDNLEIVEVEKILDEDHYGLAKVKERIVEYLAVVKLVEKMKGPILCFVGPPGVGKTSLGRSIARSLDRKFVRISLGGIHDEAEIRGHRRTYIGSMPGRIMQSIKKCGSKNPVFLLDEVDKMSSDFRGDPAAALLEVLDPEQNVAFSDHYLDTDFDLSEVMFITTANVLHTIPPALQDRMEIIRLPGYLDFEKLEIAKGFLVPKQLKAHGLDKEDVSFSPKALTEMIRKYTREAGVRNLEREIANTCRKIARSIATPNKKGVRKITASNLHSFLGVPRYIEAEIASESCVGIATGLAWTKVGGEILHVEASIMPGDGELTLTGQLGDIMQESGQAALTYARANAARLGIDEKFLEKTDVHVHIPEGAIPKDGPSAGIAMATALISAITGIPVKPDVAMTGEIILRGEVLPIGGLNEKAVAAMRAGVSTLIIPKKNEKDVKELPSYIRKGMKIELVESMAQVLALALDFSEEQTLPLLARKDEIHKESSVGGYPH